MQKNNWGISLSICKSHVTILSAIQVCRFYEMCRGIMNNPVLFAGKEIGLELLADLMNCSFMCRGQNAGKNLEEMGSLALAKFKYF